MLISTPNLDRQRNLQQSLSTIPSRLSAHVQRLCNSGAVSEATTASDILRVALEDLAAEYRETDEVKNLRHF